MSAERGLSMRFPRFIKRREDKGPLESTTPQQLAKIYRDQNDPTGAGTGKKGGESREEEEEDEEEIIELD